MFYSLFWVSTAHMSFTARRAVLSTTVMDSVQCMSLRNFEMGLEKLILLYISTFINSSSNFEIVHNNPKKKKKKKKTQIR